MPDFAKAMVFVGLGGGSVTKGNVSHMILITPDSDDDSVQQSIDTIAVQLRSFVFELEYLQSKISAGDTVNETDARKLFSDIRSWLKLAKEAEFACAERNRKALGIVGDYGLDLDAARDQVGCRLDRLRRCCHERKVSK